MRLTVGITYHNEGELLTRCIQSFWQDAEKPFEIIVYDDASSLKPESFIPKDIPVRILRSEKNQGPGQGRNLILHEAQGDWIHFHDADDWVMSGTLRQVWKLEKENDLILTEVSSYQQAKVISKRVIGLRSFENQGVLLKFAIDHFILVPSSFFRVELARKINGYRESLWQSEDWDFYIRLINEKPRFEIITEPLSAIEVRPESRSQKQVETLTCVLQAILFLQNELGPEVRQNLSNKASWVGSRLFQLGEKDLAKEAFLLAESLGPSNYPHQKKIFRAIAHHYGQEWAERVAATFRSLKQML